MQCNQQLHVRAATRPGPRTAVRSESWNRMRRPLALPAAFVAGQRRAVQTVRNGNGNL